MTFTYERFKGWIPLNTVTLNISRLFGLLNIAAAIWILYKAGIFQLDAYQIFQIISQTYLGFFFLFPKNFGIFKSKEFIKIQNNTLSWNLGHIKTIHQIELNKINSIHQKVGQIHIMDKNENILIIATHRITDKTKLGQLKKILFPTSLTSDQTSNSLSPNTV